MYDSVHGRFEGEVSVDGNNLIVNVQEDPPDVGEGSGGAESGTRSALTSWLSRPVSS